MMIRDLPALLLTCALAALLVAAPLPFGGVTWQARLALQVGVAVAVLLAAACRPGDGFRAVRWPALALLAIGAWGGLQSVPLPRAAVAALSPPRVALQDAAAALLERPPAERLPLSVTPDLSRRNACWWAALAGALGAAAVAGRRRAPPSPSPASRCSTARAAGVPAPARSGGSP